MKKVKTTYQISINITSEQDDDCGDDLCFDVEAGEETDLSDTQILLLAGDGAMQKLNTKKGVRALGLCH